jgi:hypothetical protein
MSLCVFYRLISRHFELHRLDEWHVAAVAYGPPHEADECSKGKGINMAHTIAPEQRAEDIRRIEFEILTIDQLTRDMA